MNRIRATVASLGALALALLLSSLGAFAIMRNISILPAPRNWGIDLVVSISFGAAITSAFYSGFYRGLFLKRLSPFSDSRSLVSEIPLVVSITSLLYLNQKISDGVFYITIASLQTWNTWLCFRISREGINVNHRVIDRLPILAAFFVGLFGFLAWPVRNFWPITALLVALTFWQATVHSCLLGGLWGWFAYHPRYRIPNESLLAQARLRLKTEGVAFSSWLTSLGASVFQLLSLMSVLWLSQASTSENSIILAIATQFLFVPSLLDAWMRLDKLGHDQENLAALSRLTLQSARKLILRHNQPKDIWAATVGLRTSAFTIDHDPDSIISNRVPATLTRIRNEEILSFVNQIIKHQSLSLTAISQKIVGAIDPENSARPCVDALNLCATLYLDASPMIERRISGLISLLPIVNPGLAEAINLNHMTPMLKKNNWFFHFDYSWVDQSIINTPSAARYGIQLDPVTSEASTAMLEHMRKTHSVGNFLWIGKDAYEKLLQEAPYICSIMEPNFIKTNRDQESLVFAIKFEKLIPRLQRYYGLDAVRAKIIDYELSTEAQRLLQLLTFQARNTKTLTDKKRIIDSVASYKWRGFKEKDQALKLLLQIYQSELDANRNAPSLKWSKTPDGFMHQLRNAVSQIGYPSQMMNQAHMYKIQLRDIARLRLNALNPSSVRFEEAWVLLGNLDYKRFAPDEITSIREILADAIVDKEIMKNFVVQSKIIDSTISLIRSITVENNSNEIALLLKVVDSVIRNAAAEDCIVLAFDALLFVSQLENRLENSNIQIDPETVAFIDSKCTARDKSTAVWSQQMINRWQEHRSHFAGTALRLPKAS